MVVVDEGVDEASVSVDFDLYRVFFFFFFLAGCLTSVDAGILVMLAPFGFDGATIERGVINVSASCLYVEGSKEGSDRF